MSLAGDPEVLDPRLQSELDDDLRAGLLAWQREHGAHVVFDRLLDDGYTQARVFSVVVDEVEGSVRKCVLKAVPAGERGGQEPVAHATARASGPADFVDAHIVEQPYPQQASPEGGVLMFQAVAGGDMSKVRPLSTLWENSDLPTVARRIAQALLEEWDPDPSVERMTSQDCVLAQLGRRGEPGGALDRWATALGEAAGESTLRFETKGPALPNPLTWLADTRADQEVLVHLGRAHGDLHLDNIFLPLGPPPVPEDFTLIDLSEFSERAPLCRDVPHLLLATIGRHLDDIPSGRRRGLVGRIIDAAVGADLGPGTLSDRGHEDLVEQLLSAGDEWARRQDMLDSWRQEQLLGVIGTALIQTSVSIHRPEVRWWYFELAAAALGRFLREDLRDAEAVLVGPARGAGANVAGAAERLDDVAAAFSRRKATVLLVGEEGLTDLTAASRQPWDLIVEFDQHTDTTGAYSQRQQDRDHRLITFEEQDASFSQRATVWLAADGLDPGTKGPDDFRAWRRECLPGIRKALGAFATASARPVVVVTTGPVGAKGRATLDVLLDSVTVRAELLSLDPAGPTELDNYGPEVLAADPAAVLAALPDRTPRDETNHASTVPARRGDDFVPVEISEADLAWISKSGELLRSDLGRSIERHASLGAGFYRGETVSWLELDVEVDVPQEITQELVEAVRQDLFSRENRRISLHHYPGAGGTTVARRVAWELHAEYPVLVVDGLYDALALVEHVRALHALTDNAVLVVFESTLDATIDLAYSAIRADSLPCVFLIVERRAGPSQGDGGERSFYLGPLREDQRAPFVEAFGQQVPDRHPTLTRLANSADRKLVPFLFGLTTYEADYTGLDTYVERSLAILSEREREALKLISLVHHYAGLPLPSVLLAGVLEVPDDEDVELREMVSLNLLTLLIEGQNESWRTMHDLIATESLAQLLSPPGVPAAAHRDDWKVALSTLSAELVRQTASEFGDLIPTDVRTILDQLFIVRNNKAVFTGERQLFSELMSDIPAEAGRIEILRTLAESFPQEPHFWAHLGRMLSRAKDHAAALDAIDKALNIDQRDDVLYHIKGMILSYRIRAAVENRDGLEPGELRRRVLADAQEARAQFQRSIELNDASEYGHVALVQLCIVLIEFGRRQSGAETYSTFLADPGSAEFREFLAIAEENLDRVQEIRAGDRPSRHALQAETEILAFYDDFAALLQGWRNLLDRPDLAKPPIRRQLVRAYHRRTGSWRSAPADDRARATELLDANLRDDPSDTRSLLEWLRVGRFRNVSLDRAAELIDYSRREPATAPRDILFYDYVLTALLAMAGRDTAAIEYRRKVERSRERAANFPNRRYIYEWYAEGGGLAQLVHHSDLRDWDRRTDENDPALLTRVEGRIQRIRRPQSGEIDFGSGLRAFFSPGRFGLVADRHTNARVSFLLGFTYDGPLAWSVRLLDGA